MTEVAEDKPKPKPPPPTKPNNPDEKRGDDSPKETRGGKK